MIWVLTPQGSFPGQRNRSLLSRQPQYGGDISPVGERSVARPGAIGRATAYVKLMQRVVEESLKATREQVSRQWCESENFTPRSALPDAQAEKRAVTPEEIRNEQLKLVKSTTLSPQTLSSVNPKWTGIARGRSPDPGRSSQPARYAKARLPHPSAPAAPLAGAAFFGPPIRYCPLQLLGQFGRVPKSLGNLPAFWCCCPNNGSHASGDRGAMDARRLPRHLGHPRRA